MEKFLSTIVMVLAVAGIGFASSGCTTNNITERRDKPVVTEKTTDKVTTETKTTRE